MANLAFIESNTKINYYARGSQLSLIQMELMPSSLLRKVNMTGIPMDTMCAPYNSRRVSELLRIIFTGQTQ